VPVDLENRRAEFNALGHDLAVVGTCCCGFLPGDTIVRNAPEYLLTTTRWTPDEDFSTAGLRPTLIGETVMILREFT
jgi:hypothetical protein